MAVEQKRCRYAIQQKQRSCEQNAQGRPSLASGGGRPARLEFKFSAHIAMLGTFEHIEVLIPADLMAEVA